MKSVWIAAIAAGAMMFGETISFAQVTTANQITQDSNVRTAGCVGGCSSGCGGGTVWGTSCIPQACGMKPGLFSPCPNPCQGTFLAGVVCDLKCAVDTSISTLLGTVLSAGSGLASSLSGGCDGCGIVGCEATCGLAGGIETSCGVPGEGIMYGAVDTGSPILSQPTPHAIESYGSSVPTEAQLNTSNIVHSNEIHATPSSVPAQAVPSTTPAIESRPANSVPVSSPTKQVNPFSDETLKGSSTRATTRHYRGASNRTFRGRLRRASYTQGGSSKRTFRAAKPAAKPRANAYRAISASSKSKLKRPASPTRSRTNRTVRPTSSRAHLKPILRFRD